MGEDKPVYPFKTIATKSYYIVTERTDQPATGGARYLLRRLASKHSGSNSRIVRLGLLLLSFDHRFTLQAYRG